MSIFSKTSDRDNKGAFAMMRETLSIPRAKYFNIIGVVENMDIGINNTKITVRVVDTTQDGDNVDLFNVYFVGDAKAFVDG